MKSFVLGVSAYYHDSAAALIKNGEIIAAAQEERFTRKKHDHRFPKKAIEYCLKEAGIKLTDLETLVFYDKPLVTFERLLETYIATAPFSWRQFVKAMPVWLKEKLDLKGQIRKQLIQQFKIEKEDLPPLHFTEHHQSHASSCFFPSPYEEAAILCLDGVGEWATTSGWVGEGNRLIPQWEIHFPHSLGLLYSTFTYYTGFKVNSGEYKVMGLAPYGEPKYVDTIYDNLIDVKPDGSFRLNMKYFGYTSGLEMTNSNFHTLFGGPPRKPETQLSQREMDLASSVQVVIEDVILKLAHGLHKETGKDYLCMAGGVALNCVANGKLLREGPFKDIWIQPAAGDAGGSLGAALAYWHQKKSQPRRADAHSDKMSGAYLGPQSEALSAKEYFDSIGAPYEEVPSEEDLIGKVSEVIKSENVVGWHQGRMEFGPRALCSRSIIGDARSQKMQSTMNLKIKYRESFRPFAPVVLAEDVNEFFELDRPSPYMLLVADVKKDRQKPMTEEQKRLFGLDKLHIPRSDIPAVTHVDYSARVQTIHKETNAKFYKLLSEFKKDTQCSVMVNTSFNVRGEPIVCTVEDSYRCFMRTEMDYLVVENLILEKSKQPKIEEDQSWKKEFELD